MVNARTGRVHTLRSAGGRPVTGRLASTDPNLPELSDPHRRGRDIRERFIARARHHADPLADYSQIELRIMAHLSEDPRAR
jgi:DNA polymerase-1